MRGRAAGEQRVSGEDDLQVLAVQAHRAVRVARRVDDLELHVRDVEPAAVSHVDLRVVHRVRRAPVQPVSRVQRHRRLVTLGHLDGCGDVAGVPVRADDSEYLAVANPLEHLGGVLARVDDDYLVIVTDDPRVCLGSVRVGVVVLRHPGRPHPLDPSFHEPHLRTAPDPGADP